MKWFYLTREIKSPTIMPAGSLRLVPDTTFEILRRMHGPEIVLNVTPRMIHWEIRVLAQREHERPASTVRILPCPDCTKFDPKLGRFAVTRELTYCPRCDGLHAIATA